MQLETTEENKEHFLRDREISTHFIGFSSPWTVDVQSGILNVQRLRTCQQQKFFRPWTRGSTSYNQCCYLKSQIAKGLARCGIPPDHTVQESSLHRSAAVCMELPRAHSIVLQEPDTFKPFPFESGHLHREVVAVNEHANISLHMHEQRVIHDLSRSARSALANEHWRPPCSTAFCSKTTYSIRFPSSRVSLSSMTFITKVRLLCASS